MFFIKECNATLKAEIINLIKAVSKLEQKVACLEGKHTYAFCGERKNRIRCKVCYKEPEVGEITIDGVVFEKTPEGEIRLKKDSVGVNRI